MLFNSITFAVFLPVTLITYWLAPPKHRTRVLLAASYLFYAWWDARFLSLIWISTLTDYSIGRRLAAEESEGTRRKLLGASVAVNLGMLGVFKYWNFFIESAASLLESGGLAPNVPTLEVVLPIGISFYTFQTLSYTIDIYRDRLKPEMDLTRFALFVAFFPQLVAGPIERARILLPQLSALPANIRSVDWLGAVTLIARGLFRKVVIADSVGRFVSDVFNSPDDFAGLTIATAVVGFSIQIYGDFAGYTDIARGTARLFGVDLVINFRSPYSARSFDDFWRRWHISLSTWLRDYLYIPLGGNRKGPARTYVNLMATMLLGGLWHGAGWGFVIWGFLHGLYLVVERAHRSLRSRPEFRLPPGLVFLIVTLTWIPFRATSASNAWAVLNGLLNPLQGRHLAGGVLAVGLMSVLTVVFDKAELSGALVPSTRRSPFVQGLTAGAAIVISVAFATQSDVPFIYFQF